MSTKNILNSLSTSSQIPLDSKLYSLTLNELKALGDSDYKAFLYFEDMIVQCIEDHKEYIWREEREEDEPLGLLATNYTYPPGSAANGIDYEGRKFNFFLNQALTDEQISRLQDLVYENSVNTISASPTFIEKGLVTSVDYTWNFTENDDTLVSVFIDGVDKTVEADGTPSVYNLPGGSVSKTVNMTTTVNRKGSNNTSGASTTVPAYVPQYTGRLFNTWLELPSYLYDDLDPNFGALAETKHVISGTAITVTGLPYQNEKAFILSNKSNLTIKDGNDFVLSVGVFGVSTTDFFLTKPVDVTLADGSTETMYLYVTRENIGALTDTTATFKYS